MIIKKTNGQHAFIYFFDLLSRTNTWKVTTHRLFAPINIQIGLQGFVNSFNKFRYISISDREKQKQTNVKNKRQYLFESSVLTLTEK